MRNHKLMTPLFLLAGILMATMAIGGAASAQDQDQDNATGLIEQFLPEGTTLLTATTAELAGAIENAVRKNPGKVSAIVKAAATARPDEVNDIVIAAVRVLPKERNAICFAAREAAPVQAMGVTICLSAFETEFRLNSLPVTKPARDEPSPIKPR